MLFRSNAGVVAVAGMYGDVGDTARSAERLMGSTRMLARAVRAIRETSGIVASRGVNPRDYRGEMLAYRLPAAVSAPLMKRMFARVMCFHGIRIIQTGVGDRYVLEKMLAGGYTLGGEQSGHVIDTIHATTGEGVLTSLRVAARLKRTGKSLAELASIVQRLPQILINVKGVDKNAASTNTVVQKAAQAMR